MAFCFDVCRVEYWFRCMDLDGDGVISMYEMKLFYDDQLSKMEELGMETLSFEDCLCQVGFRCCCFVIYDRFTL